MLALEVEVMAVLDIIFVVSIVLVGVMIILEAFEVDEVDIDSVEVDLPIVKVVGEVISALIAFSVTVVLVGIAASK